MIAQEKLVRLFADRMEAHGHTTIGRQHRLEHRESGIVIHPRALEPAPSPPFLRSVVVVTVNHPCFPQAGIFEYQHAVAETESAAIRDGIDQWLQLDFTVLLDALRDRPERCSVMQWEPPGGGAPERMRRVVLGPTGHAIAQPERVPKDIEHPFCACCLLTNSYQAFRSHMQSDDFYGVRLLAARDEDGSTQADCRINGHEFEAGKQALRAYAETWPQAGFEMRKQYVVMQSVSRGPA